MVNKELVDKIIYLIKNGIDLEYGNKTKFLLLDYLLLTDISLNKMMEYVKNNYQTKDVNTFYNFYMQNKDKLRKTDKKKIIALTYSFGDYKLSYNEKMRIFEFMNLNKIPISTSLFAQVATRFFYSRIDLNLDYKNNLSNKFNMEKSIDKDKIDKILAGIKEGITINNKKHKFELLDYYQITNMPMIGFRANIRKYPDSDKKLFTKFYNENRLKETSLNNNHIINLDITIKDHHLDEAEKCQILEYMINNNIPIFVSLFMQIARRYINNEIKINNKNIQIDTVDNKQLQRLFTRYKEYDTIIESKSWRY